MDIGKPLKRYKAVPLTEPVPGNEPQQPVRREPEKAPERQKEDA